MPCMKLLYGGRTRKSMIMVSSSSSVFVPKDSRPDYPGTSISRTILIFENSGGRCIRYREKSRKRIKLLSRDGIGLPPQKREAPRPGEDLALLAFLRNTPSRRKTAGLCAAPFQILRHFPCQFEGGILAVSPGNGDDKAVQTNPR